MDSIVTALRRQKSLLEQVLDLTVCEVEMLETGRLEDAEILLRLRAERLGEFEMAEAHIDVRMPHIERDPTVSPKELADLHDLNLQIIRLADCVVAIHERAQELAKVRDWRTGAAEA
jgi:hypothetical protein